MIATFITLAALDCIVIYFYITIKKRHGHNKADMY